MTIRRLRTLVAIADAGTFSAAAERVHITHAAVSQQMQALEADLGISLFDRSTRTPTMTPAARQIVARAETLIFEYDNLVPSVMGDGGLHGVIKLGVLRTTLTGLVPQAMAALKSKYPEIGLHIKPGLTATLLADIERNALDAAITTKPHLLPEGVVFRELAAEPLQCIAAMEEESDDPVALLNTRPFIRFNRTAVVGTLIENWIQLKRIAVKEMMELDSPEAIASMVHANLGVSIVPDFAVPPPDALPIKRLSLGPGAPQRVLGLVHQKGQFKTQALDEVHDALAQVVRAAQQRKTAAAI